MKILSGLFLFLFLFQTVETQQLREAYETASTSEKEASVFIALTEHIDSSATHQAYLGAAFALKAKFFGDKIPNIKKAKSLLEKAISRAPKNIEIRMIRLSIQESLPKIVGYNDAISSDKEFIIANLENVEKTRLKEYLERFIAKSKAFSTE